MKLLHPALKAPPDGYTLTLANLPKDAVAPSGAKLD